MKALRGCLIGLLLATGPVAAWAQEQPAEPQTEAPKIQAVQRSHLLSGLAVGIGAESVVTTSGHASNSLPIRFLFRLPPDSGWSFSPMFGWFGTDLDATGLDRPGAEFGRLSVRPVLVAARYTWVREPLSYDVAVGVGFSLNGFKLAEGAGPLLGLGSGPITTDANVSPAWRVQGSVWHDFNDRVAIRGALAFAYCQPEITVRSGAAGRRISENANSVQIAAGVVYRIF